MKLGFQNVYNKRIRACCIAIPLVSIQQSSKQLRINYLYQFIWPGIFQGNEDTNMVEEIKKQVHNTTHTHNMAGAITYICRKYFGIRQKTLDYLGNSGKESYNGDIWTGLRGE